MLAKYWCVQRAFTNILHINVVCTSNGTGTFFLLGMENELIELMRNWHMMSTN